MTTSLKQRLQRLRAQGPAPSVPIESDLAERLRRLDPARRRPATAAPMDDGQLAEQLGAEVVAPGVLVLERARALTERHGRWRLQGLIEAVPRLLDGADPHPNRWALIDTETSGLAGGTGTWAFCVGIGRVDGERLRLRQWLLTRLDAEPAFLDAVESALADTTLLISYNGKSFDLPLLATRFQLAERRPGLERLAHLDLLYPVRRAFASRWPDCRLASVEQRLLNAPRSDDLPGAEAPAAWLDWLRRGDPSRIGAVLRHNRIDLISLAALLPALAAVEQAPGDHAADAAAIARHRLRSHRPEQALRLLQQAQAELDGAGALLLARLHRRRGDWPAAIAIWQTLAGAGEPEATLALAKYQEHRAGACAEALRLAEALPSGPARHRRCQRLRRKCAADAQGRLDLGDQPGR